MYRLYSKNDDLEHVDQGALIDYIANYFKHFGTLIFGKGAPDVILDDGYSRNQNHLPLSCEYMKNKKSFVIYEKNLNMSLARLNQLNVPKESKIRIYILMLFAIIRAEVQKEYGMRGGQMFTIYNRVVGDLYKYCPDAERLTNALGENECSPAEQDQQIIAAFCTELSYRTPDDSEEILDECIKKLLVCNSQTFADDPNFIAEIFNKIGESSSEFIS